MKLMTKHKLRENVEGYLFVAPWLIGLLTFTLGPMLYSLYLSFCRYDPRGMLPPHWVGLANYAYALTNADGRFYLTLQNTLWYAAVAVPTGLIGSLIVALLLTREVKGQGFFRTLFYLPTVLPTLAVGMVFLWLFNGDHGLVNILLKHLGDAHPPDWFGDPRFILPSYVIATLWMTVGANMIVLIAAIKGIPRSYFEAALLDGANAWQRFVSVTVPQLTFVLFFNLVTGIIAAFQIFDLAFVMSPNGAANDKNLFYVLYLYEIAWQRHKLGYASALAWILFALILAISLLVVKSSNSWVYYEGEKR